MTAVAGNEFIDLDTALAAEGVAETSYDERDLVLYALGVGAARDPLDESDLRYICEFNRERFRALPTFAVVPGLNALLAPIYRGKPMLPGLKFGFERMLHGEQYIELKRPLPRCAKLKHTFRVKSIYDKKPHAVITVDIVTTDESGVELAYNEFSTFVLGVGGWGGERGPSGNANRPPAREADAVVEEKTAPNQALLYRLSGDLNPLHADPAFAKTFGYDRPILHGLSTFGHAARHVINAMCGGGPERFKSIKVRFGDTVFPGETLVTHIWKESPTRFIVETRIKERDKLVIRNAAVELYEQPPQR